MIPLHKDKSIIYSAFFAALLFLTVIIYLSHRAEKQYQANTQVIIHTHMVLNEGELLNSLVKDGQRTQRGFLLTLDTSYLQQFYSSRDSLTESLQRLYGLTDDNQQQQLQLKQIEKLTLKSFDYWQSMIEVNQREGAMAAIKMVRKGMGAELIDSLAQQISKFKEHELMLLGKRQVEFYKSRQQATMLGVGSGIIGLLMVISAFLLLRKRLNREVLLSRTLEEKVELRTRELQISNDELQRSTQSLQISMEELALTNNQLQRTNADLDNFVYVASHDLRSPIINLQGLLTVLLNKLDGKIGDKEREIMERMEDSIYRLNKTIKELADIAKIQKEEQVVEMLSFEEIYQHLYPDIAPLLQETKGYISTDFQVSQLQYPSGHLRSIVYNLLSNAIKYRSPDRTPEISLSTYQDDGRTVMEVKDNGLGIEKQQIEKLFRMFKRLHSHVEGTGIGLYMIKRMIENNGGSIVVESEKGVGSSFKVYF